MTTHSITLPDGTTATAPVNETSAYSWALVAPPMTGRQLRIMLEGQRSAAHLRITTLRSALGKMTVTLEAIDIEGVEPRRIMRARLDGTNLFVLTDDGHRVLDVDLDQQAPIGAPILKVREMGVKEALAEEVASDIAARRSDITNLQAQLAAGLSTDQRLNWRVLRWLPTEAAARKSAAKVSADTWVIQAKSYKLDEALPTA
jgi:hypothetical protein